MRNWFKNNQRVYVFLSYTSREDEVRELQPFVDVYCRELWQRARSNGLEVFYDHFSLERKWYSDQELETILTYHVERANLFVGFISPYYVESRWSCYEWRKGPMKQWHAFQQPRQQTQSIYWKRDYHEFGHNSQEIVSDLDERVHFDCSLQLTNMSRLSDAARAAAISGVSLLGMSTRG